MSGEEGFWQQSCYEAEEAHDVAAVGKGATCYACGGWGHIARDCPTALKGGKGKGKAKGTEGKGYAKGAGHSDFGYKGPSAQPS